MNIFDARFDIEYAYLDDAENNIYKLSGIIVDMTGVYSTSDVRIGDIIYLDGRILGFDLLRYKIVDIDTAETTYSNLVVSIVWDKPNEETIEPCGGLEGIIGSVYDGTNIASITAYNYNSANEVLVNKAVNYQMMLVATDDLKLTKRVKTLEDNKAQVSDQTPSDKEVGHIWIEIV